VSDLPAPLDLAVFRRMADMSSEAFYVADFEGRFRYVNQRALDLTGYTWRELRTMTTAEIDPDYPLAVYRRLVGEMSGPLPLVETRVRCKDGSCFPVEVSVALFAADGERYVFGVVRDITARKQMEVAQKTFAQRLLQTLEAERRRVARELHDDLGRALATVRALLRSLEHPSHAIPRDARQALTATVASIRGITDSVRRIVQDYQPAELLGAGLEDTIRTHARQFAERHTLALDLAVAPLGRILAPDRALHLFRIAQEALANIARHARASHVVVRLRRRSDAVVLTIRDDGVGIARGRVATAGLGLVTMRERAALMHARFRVRALPRRGTEVEVAVPTTGVDRARPPRRAAASTGAIARRGRPSSTPPPARC
jgi:PAS domain S-box-containing protein